MPEQQSAEGQAGSNQDGNNGGAATSGAAGQQDPQQITMTSQQLAERLARAKPADYDDLKAKAAQFDQLQEASKSDAQKAAERLAALEERAATAEMSALRSRIQARHGVSDEDAALFLTGSDEATLTKQAQRLADRDAGRKKFGNRVSREGTNSSTGAASSEREFVRELFGSGA